MKKLFFIIVIGVVFFSFSLADLFKKSIYVYQDTTGSLSYEVRWALTEKKDSVAIVSKSQDGLYNFQYTDKYILKNIEGSSKAKKVDYKIDLLNNKLIVKGNSQKGFLEKQYNIDSANWVQDFTFGLKPFLESKKSEYKFIIISPFDFSKNELIAYKTDIEDIVVNKQKYQAQKVQITLQGLKSMFWSAYVWYDIQDNKLLLYKANEGPGTQMNIISLKEKV